MDEEDRQDQSKIKKMSVKEFRELGYVQELNRRFLHPLGLALEVEIFPVTGLERFGAIWDCRDDPEGIIFDEGLIDEQKALNIYYEGAKRGRVRVEKLGYVVQPLPSEEVKDEVQSGSNPDPSAGE